MEASLMEREHEALLLLEKATGALVLNRADHVLIVEALNCLRALIQTTEEKEQNNV